MSEPNTPPDPSDETRESPGRDAGLPARIGRYEIRAVLGDGSFGRVYRGYDTVLERDVAIKAPLADRLTPEARDQFLREARTAATIHHPNVCPVYEVGTDGDLPYLVMRYVRGGTLRSLLERRHGRFPDRQAVAVVRKLALGVAAAHERGLVHRDLKPANVLFDEATGDLLVTNFDFDPPPDGLSHPIDGAVWGMPAYLSPERLFSRSAPAGPPSNVYALGVILYELLTGRVPYQGSVFEVLAQVWEGKPVPPGQFRPDLDPRLEAICLKAMAKEPQDRFPSAAALAGALRDYLATAVGSGSAAALPPSSPLLLPRAMPRRESEPEPERRRARARSELPPASRSNGAPLLGAVAGAAAAVAEGLGRLARRAGGSGAPRPAVELPRPITDRVHFSVTAPAALRAGGAYALTVWAHLAAHRDEVLARARQAHPLGPVQIHTRGGVPVARGTTLAVRLKVPTLRLVDPDEPDVIEWDGDIGGATFAVAVPPGAAAGSHLGTATVYAAGLQIARLHFELNVADDARPSGLLAAREVRHRRAFVSYASGDRRAVLARVQGLQKARPDLDIYMDVVSLRSGERWRDRLREEIAGRDVFYLFWSRNASRSKEVEWEWRTALETPGLDSIDPVPLVDPRDVPPPAELAGLHFNDWVLAYLRAPAPPGGRARALVAAAVAAGAVAAAAAVWAATR